MSQRLFSVATAFAMYSPCTNIHISSAVHTTVNEVSFPIPCELIHLLQSHISKEVRC